MAADLTDRRSGLASPATANIVAILGAALLIAAIPFAALTHSLTGPTGVALIPVIFGYGGVGLVVARRQPRNPVGWILLGGAVLLAASDCAGAYTALIYRSGHGALPLGPAAVLLALLWAPAIVLTPLAGLLFPDGTVLSPSWRWVLRAYLVIGASWPVCIYTVAIATLTGQRIQVDSLGYLTTVAQPAGNAAWLVPAQELILPALLVGWMVFRGSPESADTLI